MSCSEALAARVVLAFDDFSRAGKHVLRLACKSKTPKPMEALQGLEFGRFVETWTSEDAMVSFVVVHSALVPREQLWALADALSQAFELAGVKSVTVVGAVHLPYAKPSGDGGALDGVYYAAVGADPEDEHEPVPSKELQLPGPDWELKDAFLSSLLHLLVVDSACRVHLLLAKGYKPGRNLAGTYEAAEALAAALETFMNGKLAVDPTDLKLALPALLAEDPSLRVDSSSSTASSIGVDTSLLYN